LCVGEHKVRFITQATIATKLLAAAGTTIGVLLIIAALALSRQTHQTATGLSENYARALGEQVAADVAGDLGSMQATATAMAGAIAAAHESGVQDRATIMQIARSNLESSDLVMGSWFFAAPEAFDGRDAEFVGQRDLGSNTNGRFEPYWAKSDEAVIMEPPEDDQVFTSDFYRLAAESRKPAITDPYPYPVNGKTVMMTSVTAPVISGGQVIGVAGLDIALDAFSTQLGQIRPLGDGRVMLLSGAGKWVTHHDAKKLMAAYADPSADEVGAAIKAGKELSLKDLSIGGETVERLLLPVDISEANARWGVVVDVPTATLNAPARNMVLGMLIGGVLVIGLVLGGLWIAANRIVARPLDRLTRTVGQLSSGRYDTPVQGVEGHDEVGQIARALEAFRHELASGVTARKEQEVLRADAEAQRARNAEAERESAERQAVVVTALEEALARLSEGDLTARVAADFAPEYQKLKADFNAAMGKLEGAMGGVLSNTASITSGAREISQAADDLSRRTEQQAASLEETAAALDEITVTVRKTADGAEHASAVVARARADARGSGEVVANAVSAMGEIEQSSQQISQIIGVIDEIAFQTNLLALNAGVEAARAGEAGRGFAVVASEVRALAQRSAEAAKEIKGLISASTEHVSRGVALVGDTGQALERIVGQITEISGIVEEIAASSKEQASGLGQVNTAVNQMDQVTQQNAAMVEESTAASHALAKEATELAQLMNQFRIGTAQRGAASGARAQQARLAQSVAGLRASA
jgi:methyl-accepting chemotaxis protein